MLQPVSCLAAFSFQTRICVDSFAISNKTIHIPTEYNEVYEADIRVLQEAQSLKERHVSLPISADTNTI